MRGGGQFCFRRRLSNRARGDRFCHRPFDCIRGGVAAGCLRKLSCGYGHVAGRSGAWGYVAGRASSDLTGGSNTEDQEAFRARVMDAYREPPRGGAEMDYATWAISVPGVTRAWCLRNGYGAGTVVVYIMLDAAQAGHDGFPVGQDGVATDEPRGVPAVGDQLTVANALYPLQPVTALVYVCSPRRNSLTLTLEGLSGASLSTRAAIAQAVAGVLMLSGSPNRAVVNRTDLVTAIRAVPQTAGFVLGVIVGRQGGVDTEYSGNITSDQDTCPFWRTSFTDHRRGSNGCLL